MRSEPFVLLSSVDLWPLNGQQLLEEVSQEQHTTFSMILCDFAIAKSHKTWTIGLSRSIFHPFHLHVPRQSCKAILLSFQILFKHFGLRMHTCMVPFEVLYQYQYCACLVPACCLWCVYIPHHQLPFPPPVLSVPANSKGRVSATSLQRSRSDVDVNAAAVAKHRYVGQTRAAGHLPPGSYSSLGKGPARWNEWLKGCRHQSARWTVRRLRWPWSFGHLVKVPALWILFTPIEYCPRINTLDTHQCLGWPLSSHLLFPPSFSPPLPAILVRILAWAFYICMFLYVKLILHVDWPDSVIALSVSFFKTNA